MPNEINRNVLSRRELLRFTSAVGAAALAPLPAAASPNKLNFVFILIDDMGWKDLGCYGSGYFETPNIDRLASQGMHFTDAYAAAPLCSPTRASIMTGKHPARLNLTTVPPGGPVGRKMRSEKYLSVTTVPALPLSDMTIPEALKPAGYVSAHIGKWHLGRDQFGPGNRGFDVAIGPGPSLGQPPAYFYPAWAGGRGGGVNIEGRPGEYLTDRLTDEAIGFLEGNREKPFFLYLAHYAVHTPIQGKEDVTAKYQRKTKPGDLQRNAAYAAMVESVDASVGRVLKKLDDLGIAERTVVFLMSDNGGVAIPLAYDRQPVPMTSNLPLRAGKAHLYEGGIREPMIVRWPGAVKPGSVSSVPVISTDFFPTIVEMAGLKPDPANTIDGMSLVSLLKGQAAPKREALYWHFPHYDYRPAAAVRQGDWKFMEFMDNGHLELYNLAEDLGERTNVAAQLPARAAEMQQMLHRWQKDVGARMMAPNPDYEPPPVD